jgi:NADP-dependent 3-hydroxy acid dehydrogenase YdfG
MTNSSQTRVWLITGSSTGFGRMLAEAVLDQGETVVLTARNPQQVEDLTAKFPDRTLAARLDVTNPTEVREVVKVAIAQPVFRTTLHSTTYQKIAVVEKRLMYMAGTQIR